MSSPQPDRSSKKLLRTMTGFHGVDLDLARLEAPAPAVGRMRLGQAPEPLPPPGVEGPVVAGLADSVVDVVVFDDVAAPCSVADADPRARHVIDRVVRRRDPLGAGDVDAGGLLAENAAVVDEVVGDGALVGEAAPCPVRQAERADQTDGAVARLA